MNALYYRNGLMAFSSWYDDVLVVIKCLVLASVILHPLNLPQTRQGLQRYDRANKRVDCVLMPPQCHAST